MIKDFCFLLTENQKSEKVTLVDKEGEGDMHFTFSIRYINKGQIGTTHIDLEDKFNANITIETRPDAITTLKEAHSIGTYAKGRKLFINFKVGPLENNKHNLVVNFYAE